MSEPPCLVAAFAAELPPASCRRGLSALVVGARGSWAGRSPGLPPGRGLVLVVGSCGALRDDVARATLVVPASVVAADGTVLRPDAAWAARLAAAAGPRAACRDALAEATAPVDPRAARAELASRTGARFVDLETASLARTAEAAGRPWAALRWVSDTPSHRLAALARLLGGLPAIDPSVGEMLGALARRPWLLPGLVDVGLVAIRGRRAAGRVLERALAWTEGPGTGV